MELSSFLNKNGFYHEGYEFDMEKIQAHLASLLEISAVNKYELNL